MRGLIELRTASQIAARTLSELKTLILQGNVFNGSELDHFAEMAIETRGGTPAFKGYQGFPASICLSLNEEVVHGIPFSKKIKKGDLVSIDIGVKYKGYYGDVATSFVVCKNPFLNNEKKNLVKATKLCLDKAIECLRFTYPDCYLHDIPCAIMKATKGKYSIAEGYGGHGIGQNLHQDFFVPNILREHTNIQLEIGQALCIEPMLTLGTGETIENPKWHIVTRDGSLAAHFEHTVVITKNGIEVLTEL